MRQNLNGRWVVASDLALIEAVQCESAGHLTHDRLPRLTPPVPPNVSDTAMEVSQGLGSRSGADRG